MSNGIEVVIPPKANRKEQRYCNWWLYDEDGTVSAIAKMMTEEELKKLDNTQIISNQVITTKKGHDLLKSKKIRSH